MIFAYKGSSFQNLFYMMIKLLILAFVKSETSAWFTAVVFPFMQVKIAAYKNGVEAFHTVFDSVDDTKASWFDCSRVLYTSVNGLDRNSLINYTCSIQE